MGLRATIAAAAKSAFGAVGDLPVTMTLTRTANTYNATTGAASTSATTYAASAILTSFALKEADGIVVLSEDKKAIIRQSGLAVTPRVTDTLVNAAGKVHQIISVRQDPAGATWTLHIRAAS